MRRQLAVACLNSALAAPRPAVRTRLRRRCIELFRSLTYAARLPPGVQNEFTLAPLALFRVSGALTSRLYSMITVAALNHARNTILR
jgi:hypothetical protein